MIKILIVDDHAMVRTGLTMLLNDKDHLEVVGEAAEGKEGIQKALDLEPDVVLMDLSMPNGLDGLPATSELKKCLPHTAILILTMNDDDEYLFRSIHAGASGFILKNAPHEELLNAIECVAADKAYLYPTATKRLMEQYIDQFKRGENIDTYEKLSIREKEVLSCVAKGYANKEIAQMLNLSVKTVESHKGKLMEKLNMKTRPELVKYAVKKGLLQYE
ncbi:response regulator transcription factor [Longirhabdus pacifica]|uniref:response regulator transcription factor n=1 Tax=Longirhabdus pacifica TaxID=2305227 RepID=UPI001008BF40|nr:response regulator transcription factor [Longirhabdus pacifica]